MRLLRRTLREPINGAYLLGVVMGMAFGALNVTVFHYSAAGMWRAAVIVPTMLLGFMMASTWAGGRSDPR